jgi:hypothetical protein
MALPGLGNPSPQDTIDSEVQRDPAQIVHQKGADQKGEGVFYPSNEGEEDGHAGDRGRVEAVDQS